MIEADDDKFFGELADTIDEAVKMTRERLNGGELERRREAIMDSVRASWSLERGKAHPAPDCHQDQQ